MNAAPWRSCKCPPVDRPALAASAACVAVPGTSCAFSGITIIGTHTASGRLLVGRFVVRIPWHFVVVCVYDDGFSCVQRCLSRFLPLSSESSAPPSHTAHTAITGKPKKRPNKTGGPRITPVTLRSTALSEGEAFRALALRTSTLVKLTDPSR